jgi:hypothetical protein
MIASARLNLGGKLMPLKRFHHPKSSLGFGADMIGSGRYAFSE